VSVSESAHFWPKYGLGLHFHGQRTGTTYLSGLISPTLNCTPPSHIPRRHFHTLVGRHCHTLARRQNGSHADPHGIRHGGRSDRWRGCRSYGRLRPWATEEDQRCDAKEVVDTDAEDSGIEEASVPTSCHEESIWSRRRWPSKGWTPWSTLIRIKRIYNFWCSMIVLTPFA
jgi:hypothetical protein